MYIPTVLPPHPFRRLRSLLLPTLALAALPAFAASPPAAVAAKAAPDTLAVAGVPGGRTFRAFLPRPGASADEPRGHIIQLLLDRQEKDGYESYLIQVLFRGAPALENVQRVLPDRVEVDFLDTGKPSMRLARIRGGAVRSTSLEEFHYRDGGKLKSMVRLTLFTTERPVLRVRNTLDRSLIHFRLERKSAPSKGGMAPETGSKSVRPPDSRP